MEPGFCGCPCCCGPIIGASHCGRGFRFIADFGLSRTLLREARRDLAAAWSLIVTIGSFMLGGYIAGRMRSSWAEGGADEVAFRDGMHGFLVWSLGIVAGALLAMVATITMAQVGAQVATTVAQGDAVLAPATGTLLRVSSKPTTGALLPLPRPRAQPSLQLTSLKSIAMKLRTSSAPLWPTVK